MPYFTYDVNNLHPYFSTLFDRCGLNSVQGDQHIILFSTGVFPENHRMKGYNFYGCKLNYIYEGTCRVKARNFAHKESHTPQSAYYSSDCT